MVVELHSGQRIESIISMPIPDKESRPPSKELRRTQAVEWIESTTKPDRQICKLDTASPKIDDNELQELYDSLPRFGPFYITDEESLMSKLKEATWQHILTRAHDSNPKATYSTSLRNIEAQARGAYVDGIVDDESKVTRSQFIQMMIKDGCFILQLALFALGGSEQLCYPPDHLVFGKQRNTDQQIRRWIKSLFFVGNQIPLVVLRELMNGSFFQQVVMKGKWEQPRDLFKRVLYDLLVLPVLEERSQQCHHTRTTLLQALKRKLRLEKKSFLLQQQPTDLLHGLQMLVIGPGGDSPSSTNYKNDETVVLDIESSSFSYKIHSATELRQRGIHFKHTKGIGSGGIKFMTNMFRAVLTLPTFLVDDDTEVLFQYLKNYEISQPLGSNKGDVCSYLQFMSELIRTSEDVKLLVDSGIISRTTPEQRERLPGILKRLASGDTNPNLRLVRLKIDDYSRPPWDKIRNFLSLVLLLTVVQTIYTVLGYYKKP
ncbi:unnamed protein product [Camellia sinensis]